MRTSSLAALAAFVTTVTAVPVSDLNKRYTGPNGQTQNTSAGGTGPNPNVSGDGGNGLTVSDLESVYVLPAHSSRSPGHCYRPHGQYDDRQASISRHHRFRLCFLQLGLAPRMDRAGEADRRQL